MKEIANSFINKVFFFRIMSFFGLFGDNWDEDVYLEHPLIDKIQFSNTLVQVEEFGRTLQQGSEFTTFHNISQQLAELGNDFFRYQKTREQLLEMGKRKMDIFNLGKSLQEARAQYKAESAQVQEWRVQLKDRMRVTLMHITKGLDALNAISEQKCERLKEVLAPMVLRLGKEINLEKKYSDKVMPKAKSWW